jgi:hypothetical protein
MADVVIVDMCGGEAHAKNLILEPDFLFEWVY